jgi:hypothetical protein
LAPLLLGARGASLAAALRSAGDAARACAAGRRRYSAATALPDDPFGTAAPLQHSTGGGFGSGTGGDESPAAAHRNSAGAAAAQALEPYATAALSASDDVALPFDAPLVDAAARAAAAMCAAAATAGGGAAGELRAAEAALSALCLV